MSTVKKITYSESKEMISEIGLKKWSKIGVEVELREDDDHDKTFEQAKSLVEKWGKDNMPEQGKFNPYSHIHDPNMIPIGESNNPPPIRNLAAERLEILIEQATSHEELLNLLGQADKYGLKEKWVEKGKSIEIE